MTDGMRNPNAKHTDFGFLKGIIRKNPKAQASNVDMIFERKGHVLIGEWKRAGENMSEGQKRLLRALSDKPDFYVYIIEGYSYAEEREVGRIYKLQKEKLTKLGAGEAYLIKMIQSWYAYVDSLQSSVSGTLQ